MQFSDRMYIILYTIKADLLCVILNHRPNLLLPKQAWHYSFHTFTFQRLYGGAVLIPVCGVFHMAGQLLQWFIKLQLYGEWKEKKERGFERGENENGLSPPFERTRKCYLTNVMQIFPQFEMINFALSYQWIPSITSICKMFQYLCLLLHYCPKDWGPVFKCFLKKSHCAH